MIYMEEPIRHESQDQFVEQKPKTNKQKEKDLGNVMIQFSVSNLIIFKIKGLEVHNNFSALETTHIFHYCFTKCDLLTLVHRELEKLK